MRRPDPGDVDEQYARRDVLRALGAIGATGLLGSTAGCSGMTRRRYEAAPVALEAPAKHGCRLFAADTWEVTRTPAMMGLEAEVTLVNNYAAYHGEKTTFGAAAIPAVEEGGQVLNPLGTDPLAEVIRSEAATNLLGRLGIGGDGDEADAPEWQRGPERLTRGEVEILGQPSTAGLFAGVTAADDAVLLAIARVIHDGDIVFAVQAATQSQESDGATQPLMHIWDDAWIEWMLERIKNRLPWIYREWPCQYGLSIEITVPDDGGSVNPAGATTGGYQFKIEDFADPPQAVVRGAHRISCDLTGAVDQIRWDIKRTSGPTGKWPAKNTWERGPYASPGKSVSIRLPDYDPTGAATGYELRVLALDTNGKQLASDQISYDVNANE